MVILCVFAPKRIERVQICGLAGRGAGRARGKEKKVGGTCARRAQRAREARERPSGRKKKSQGTFYLMSLPGAFPLVLRRFVGDHFSDSRGN